MRIADSKFAEAVPLAGSTGTVIQRTESGCSHSRQSLFGTIIGCSRDPIARKEAGVRRPSTVDDDPRGASAGRSGAARSEIIARVTVFFVVGMVFLGLPGTISAQLCTWDGTPMLPPPEVEVLGSQLESLRAPARLAVDSGDNVYVTDPTRGSIVIMDVQGRVIEVHSEMGAPLALAVDDFGNTYVSDDATGRVDIYDEQWNLSGTLGVGTNEFLGATDIAIDPDPGFGEVFVADGKANLIKVYDPDGLPIRSFGGSGSGPGEFDFPSTVWVSPYGEVFVGDQNNDRVQVFDRQGAFLRCFGAQGGGDRNFGRIQGLRGDAIGRIYVADAFQSHVKVFDGAGAELAVIGSIGDHPGQFRTPFGLVIDGHNRLFVSSVNSGRIEVFGLDDFTVPPPTGSIFVDGFESGDVNAWSATFP